MHYLAFDKEWFVKHQKILLWFLNNPLTKKWARYVLRIHKDCTDKLIVQIFPHAYTWFNGLKDGRVYLSTDFRTHWKFSKRIYYAFRPLWWAMHVWDIIADPLFPQASFGFSTLTQYPGSIGANNPVDGLVQRNAVDESWATIIAGAGNNSSITGNPTTVINLKCSATTNQFSQCLRSIFLFDTSALTASASISAAVMSLYGFTKADDFSATPNIDIYTATPASDTTLANGDYSQLGATSQTGSPVTYAGWTSAAYNDFTFNATGIGNISKTGNSKFGARNENYDVAGVAPTWSGGNEAGIYCYFSDQAGTTNDPKLVVTYSILASSVPGPVSFIPSVAFHIKDQVIGY